MADQSRYHYNSDVSQALLQPHQINDADSIYTLPVVIHVIHTGTPVGSADNPTDAQIIAMITNLNNAFRMNGASFGGVDIKIQFQLAVRSPFCVSASGINRVDGSVIPYYVSGGITNNGTSGSADEIAVKNLSKWPNTDYINIWIVNKINGNSTVPGGYTYFPELNNVRTDGLVLNASVVDGSNKTVVHEMGHYFYLFHTFHDDNGNENSCATNTDCSNQGDMICDTEPCLLESNCAVPSNTCTGNPFIIEDAIHGYTVLNNFMGYTDCQWMFTPGQKTRMRWALFAFRHSLISSGALNLPTSLTPASACIPTAPFGLSNYYGVQQLDFNTLHVYSNTSNAEAANYIDRTCNQTTTVIKGQVYPLSVTGSYLNPHNFKVYIDYNGNGSFSDPGELLLSDYNSISTTNVFIPLTGIKTNTPVRLRVVADNPAGLQPSSCQLAGDVTGGSGQAEDYSVVILKRQITSIGSGPWNIPTNWSCNCIPQDDDQVTIKSGYTITVTNAMGTLQCGKLSLESGAICNINGTNLKVTGN